MLIDVITSAQSAVNTPVVHGITVTKKKLTVTLRYLLQGNMAVLVEWYTLKMTSFLMIPCLILCITTMELMAQPSVHSCENPLGMESGAIRDDQITASRNHLRNPPQHARLNGESSWTTLSDPKPWIQVDFERNLWVTGLATQGDPGFGNVARAYTIEYGADGTDWQTIQDDQNLDQTFPGNVPSNQNGTVRNNFTNPISLRYIRIHPTQFVAVTVGLRFELYGCEALEICKDPLGMESGAIQNDQITASSSHIANPPHNARLHGESSWITGVNPDPNQWIQIEFEQTLWVTGLATQGHPFIENWVRAYSVEYGTDGTDWQTIQDDQNVDQIFPGNTVRGNTTVRNNFTSPISLRFIRIHPTQFVAVTIGLRFEIYGCEASDLTTTLTPSTGRTGINTEQLTHTSTNKRTPSTSMDSTSISKTPVVDLMTSSPDIRTEKTTGKTTTTNIQTGLIVGVAIGSSFFLLVSGVAFIWCMRRVCKGDKANARQHPSAKETKKDLHQSQITDGTNYENGEGRRESILDLEPIGTKPGNQAEEPSNQGKEPGNQETRLSESDQTYEEINESEIGDKAMKTIPSNQGLKPGNQETKTGYQRESDHTYDEVNQDPSTSNAKPVQSKAAVNESLHHTYFDPKINVAKPVYGNAAVFKFVGK